MMADKEKGSGHKKFPPANQSVHYYTDPIYSTDALYGFEEDEEPDAEKKSKGRIESCASDEPVESWGWINQREY